MKLTILKTKHESGGSKQTDTLNSFFFSLERVSYSPNPYEFKAYSIWDIWIRDNLELALINLIKYWKALRLIWFCGSFCLA